MAVIDSLLVALGYEFDGEDAEKFDKANKLLTKGILAVGAAAVASAAAIGKWATSSADASNETAKLARNTGLAVDEFDALQFAAGQTQIDGAALASGLEQLSIRASEAARGIGSGVEAFGLLGVQVTDVNGELKTTDQLLLESADALNQLDDQGQRLELADKLGLKDLNLLLLEGSGGITKLTDEARKLGVVTAEDAKAAEQFIDEWARFTRVIAQTGRMIATKILPIMTAVVEVFREWVMENDELMSSGIVTWFSDLSNVLRLVAAAIIAVMATKFILWIVRVIKVIKALRVAMITTWIAGMLPIIAVVAAIAALTLIVDDLIAAFTGGKSVIGSFWESLNEWIDESLEAFDNWIDDITSGIQGLVDDITNFLKPVTELFNKLFGDNNITATVNNSQQSAAAISTSAAQAIGQDQSVNNSTSSNKTEIGQVVVQVDGGNPEEVRRVVQETLSGEIQQATTTLDSAVGA